MMLFSKDIICAIATPLGSGAIAVIRISGAGCIKMCDAVFRPLQAKKTLANSKGYTLHYGTLFNKDEIVDDVMVSVFKSPKSYTGEDAIEISCHGSRFIQQKILELLIESGARMAEAGEFTFRAFINGKYNLMQAEAIADLISAQSPRSHQLALSQLRGGYSEYIKSLREQLKHFATLIELELDFSEEDVEFADRTKLLQLLDSISKELISLKDSFTLGNVIKNGVPVAIIGKPNVGKSTLLNALLNEERAIVSEIPGTTRDTVEDTIVIEGITFRFIDTAGLRHTNDAIESIGIERTYQTIEQAMVILYVIDVNEITIEQIKSDIEDFKEHIENVNKSFIIVANKADLISETPAHFKDWVGMETIFISAKRNVNINLITDSLLKNIAQLNIEDQTIVSNSRHFESFLKTLEALKNIKEAFEMGVTTDLIATDLKLALHYLGLVTGEISSEEVLQNIFSGFCIGK